MFLGNHGVILQYWVGPYTQHWTCGSSSLDLCIKGSTAKMYLLLISSCPWAENGDFLIGLFSPGWNRVFDVFQSGSNCSHKIMTLGCFSHAESLPPWVGSRQTEVCNCNCVMSFTEHSFGFTWPEKVKINCRALFFHFPYLLAPSTHSGDRELFNLPRQLLERRGSRQGLSRVARCQKGKAGRLQS